MKKKLTLTMDSSLYSELERVAKENGVSSVEELMKQAIGLILIVAKAKNNPNLSIVVRENGQEQEVIIKE